MIKLSKITIHRYGRIVSDHHFHADARKSDHPKKLIIYGANIIKFANTHDHIIITTSKRAQKTG